MPQLANLLSGECAIMEWSRSRRCACGIALLLAGLIASHQPARAWCIWGFGRCEPARAASPIAGEYVRDGNAAAALTITRDKITSRTGPVSFTVDYTVKSVDGANVTIEAGPAEAKETIEMRVEKDLLRIRSPQHFAGTWKKKPASQ
jgi:hypothetical protein